MTLENLLDITKNLQAEVKELPWHEDDVRHSFFGLYYSTLYDFYLGKSTFRLMQLIVQGDVMFTHKIADYHPHAQRLHEIPRSTILSRGYHGDLNRNIILGTWTTFELSISLIFDFLVDDFEYDNIVKSLNAKLVKAMSSLEESNKAIIMEILRKSSFVPLIRKMNFIIKHNKELYGGNLTEDRDFVEFVNRLRNCMIHSNGYYHGLDYRYEFRDTVFEFNNKQIFTEVGENRDVYLDISLKLKEIFTNLCLCVSDIKLIPYPDDGANIA
jgi:hypothetical protein